MMPCNFHSDPRRKCRRFLKPWGGGNSKSVWGEGGGQQEGREGPQSKGKGSRRSLGSE